MSNEPENPTPESEETPAAAPEETPASETPPASNQPAPAAGGGSDKKVIAGVLGILLG